MKEINELKQKMALRYGDMKTIMEKAKSEKRDMNDDELKRYKEFDADIKRMEEELPRLERMDDLTKRLAGENVRNENDGEKKDLATNFFKAFREYAETNGRVISKEFMGREGGLLVPKELLVRANPILSTTNTSLSPVTVSNELSMVTGDNFSLLQSLGVKFYPGLTGKHEIPYMAQLSTSKPGEGVDASTADASPLTVELAPQAYSNYQVWSKQALLTSPEAIYTGIIEDMQLANERQVVADLFSELIATDTSVAPTASGLTYGDMINLTNISYNIGNAAYVTDNNIRVYLEQKAVNSTGISLAWNALNNTVGGRKAISSTAMGSKKAIYGNFSYAGVGIWGQPEIIINPYTYDSTGKLKVTVLGFYDTVCRNKWAFKHFSADASCAV